MFASAQFVNLKAADTIRSIVLVVGTKAAFFAHPTSKPAAMVLGLIFKLIPTCEEPMDRDLERLQYLTWSASACPTAL